MNMTVGDYECAQNLSLEPKVCDVYYHNRDCEQCAICASSVHVRHTIVEVNVVIGVVLGELLVGVRVVPNVVCDAVVRRTLILIAVYRGHCFHRRNFRSHFSVFGDIVFTPPVGDGRLPSAVTEF